ncbi:MAG TPA: M48 family metalloprotease [Vicinamibacterales bacterium]|nr:M48 family metalloprotease [Vicinamibacterales bacterium]
MKGVVLGLVFLGLCTPAYAQFGGLLQRAEQVAQAKKKIDDLNVTEKEEIQIGQQVSAKIRQRFGVVQDPAVTTYVTLVGMLLARASARPNLPWQFVVLDTDGVNAFAAPGGIIHITRGALGLIHNEAELAGVLGHEITHVAHRHTVNAIRKNRLVQLGTHEALKDRAQFLEKVADKTYDFVLENAFDRHDELDADKGAVALTRKLGYAPSGLADFLERLDQRNQGMAMRNGWFRSHPATQERIEKIRALVGSETGATVEARYKANVSYQATPLTQIATVVAGSAGLAGSSSNARNGNGKEKKADQPKAEKKKGFGLANLQASLSPESQSAQVSASGGARGLGPDVAAKGGPDPNIVVVTVTNAELAAFKKGIHD